MKNGWNSERNKAKHNVFFNILDAFWLDWMCVCNGHADIFSCRGGQGPMRPVVDRSDPQRDEIIKFRFNMASLTHTHTIWSKCYCVAFNVDEGLYLIFVLINVEQEAKHKAKVYRPTGSIANHLWLTVWTQNWSPTMHAVICCICSCLSCPNVILPQPHFYLQHLGIHPMQ